MSATLKIPYAQPSFFGTEEAYLVQAFRSTWISGGTFVDRFEEDFRRYCGTRYAVTASNGTTALHMAYLALGIKHGELSVLYPMVSLANVWTLAWSRLFFKEPITRGKTMGLLLILIGVFFIGLGAEPR